jgi:transcriptional regulator with XRE-family HTH domain
MDITRIIIELRESTGMTRKDFSNHTGIPVRTLEDWEAGRRRPPEYIPRLLAYQIKFENNFTEKKKSKEKRNVSVIQDVDGNNIVIINDIRFKGKRSLNWDDVEEYLWSYVGDFYSIAESNEIVYIGTDLPDEYSHSEYTRILKGANEKAKANAAQGLPELINTAKNMAFTENSKAKHQKDAMYGWYKYESRFALPVFGSDGEIERYNVFHAAMIFRHAQDGKKYLYDIMNIKKKRATFSSRKTLLSKKTIPL